MRNKDKAVLVWMSEKERNTLKRKAKKYGMTVSELVRHALIHSDDLSIATVDTAPLKKLAFEMHKHGVNLNQLMRFCNTYGLEAFNEGQVASALEAERAAFAEARAALRSLEEEARARHVAVRLETPEDEAGEDGEKGHDEDE